LAGYNKRHFSPLVVILENRRVTLFHSGMSPVGMTQNERFLSCDTVLIGVRCVGRKPQNSSEKDPNMQLTEINLRNMSSNRYTAGSGDEY
jgi:hypothetical protein